MSMFLNAFEFTSEDIVTILRAHDTDITIQQLAEIHSQLDHDSIVRSALQYDDPNMQLKSALSQAEDLMIMDGLYITEPKNSMLTINLRKTFARVVYYIEQTDQGKSKETILKELDLSEDEFQFLLNTMLSFSALKDNEATISSFDIIGTIYIGGIYLTAHNKDLISL